MLDKKYNHIDVEKNKYEEWKSKGYLNLIVKVIKLHIVL